MFQVDFSIRFNLDLIYLEYNEKFKVTIDRKNRTFSRACKRGLVNFKVWHVR